MLPESIFQLDPTHQPTVTVGIITHNRVEYLRIAINSALLQGDYVSEILVVDDGSADGTKEYLTELQSNKIRVVRFEENRGRPAARNAVIESMSGDLLVWLDDDDALVENAVKSHLQRLQATPEADIVYGNWMICNQELQPQEAFEYAEIDPNLILMRLTFEDVIPNGGTLVRKSLFERVGKYNVEFDRAQDYEFWVRAALTGGRFVHNNNAVCLVRHHNDNLANPIVNCKQSDYHCKIIKYIIANANIEDIFPVLDWQHDSKEAAAYALASLAKIFFDHGDDESALECADQSLAMFETWVGKVIRAYILRAINRTQEAAELFAQAIAEEQPGLASMNVEVGVPRGSFALADAARQGNMPHDKSAPYLKKVQGAVVPR